MDKLPKKRGRKPKSHIQTDTNISNSTLEKKKRGRKPKPKDIKLSVKDINRKILYPKDIFLLLFKSKIFKKI